DPSRDQMTMRAPAAPMPCAIASPNPELPPVTTAVSPARSGTSHLLVVLGKPDRRVGEVDEASLVLQQLPRGAPAFRRRTGLLQGRHGLEPQCGDAVERLRRTADRGQDVAGPRVDRVT